MNRGTKCALFLAMLTTAGIGQAAEIGEFEPNDFVHSPQRLDIPESIEISAALGNLVGDLIPDLDYYKFHGQEGDVVDIDIDGAFGGVRSFDSYIAVFGTGPGFPMLRESDDASPADPGSASIRDSRIDRFRLPASGYYVVGVSNYPRYLGSGGAVVDPTRIANGDYKLLISGVTPAVTQINIDIRPGSDGLAPINPKSKGKVPVALLSSSTFDAKTIDRTSVTFGPTGDQPSLHHCGGTEDVNGDGYVDLICHFQNQIAGFAAGDLEGIVRGRTLDGLAFEGRGLLKVVPQKRQL